MERNWRAFRALPQREQRDLMERFARWRDMPPERRAQMREAFGEILNAPPRDRQRFLENLHRWREMSPQEREQARERWRQRRERWRR